MELIRGISGIRGIAGKTFTADTILRHVRAFITIQDNGPILLARDSRQHGKEFIQAGYNGLTSLKREVLNYDIIPTPTAQFLVEKNNLAGGIVITASHNPTEWNGLKFIDSDGCFLNADKNQKLFQLADDEKLPEFIEKSAEFIPNGHKPHIDHTLSLSCLDIEAIRKRNFSVVVDAVNGAASYALPELLEALGCRVQRLHCTPDGTFPRGAEPLPHNLEPLGKAVQEYKAQVGFATDPDGDRLAVVDEQGSPLGEEYTLTICADGFLQQKKTTQPLITNLSTTLAIDKIAEKHGTTVLRSAVGEINVVNMMKECGSLLGGEGNGGVILPESHFGRDSLVGAALFLHRMAMEEKTVSSIFKSMPHFEMVKEKIELKSINAEEALNKIETHFNGTPKDNTDGLKLNFKNSWVHIRKSNTEPILRIYAEAENTKLAAELTTKVKNIIY